MLYYESFADENIHKAVSRLLLLDAAAIFRNDIITVFNDIVLTLEPDGNVEAILAVYFEKLRKRGEVQQMGKREQNMGMILNLSKLTPGGPEYIVRRAAALYIMERGRVPNMCWTNPPLFPEKTIVAGITVKPGASYILKRQLWIDRFEEWEQ